MENIDLYVVRNSEGKFFRAKGYGGGGSSWVDGLKSARVYTSLGPARSTVTYFSADPNYPPPEIVKLLVIGMIALDETERLEKVKRAQIAQKEKLALREAKRRLDRASSEYESASINLRRAQIDHAIKAIKAKE